MHAGDSDTHRRPGLRRKHQSRQAEEQETEGSHPGRNHGLASVPGAASLRLLSPLPPARPGPLPT